MVVPLSCITSSGCVSIEEVPDVDDAGLRINSDPPHAASAPLQTHDTAGHPGHPGQPDSYPSAPDIPNRSLPRIPKAALLRAREDENGDVPFDAILLNLLDVASLVVVLRAHRVSRGSARKKADLFAIASRHQCNTQCAGIKFSLSHSDGGARPSDDDDAVRAQVAKHLETNVMSKFPPTISTEKKRSIISNWIDRFSNSNMKLVVCTVCSERLFASQCVRRSLASDELELLTNPSLPAHTLPDKYDLAGVSDAILDPLGFDDDQRGPIRPEG